MRHIIFIGIISVIFILGATGIIRFAERAEVEKALKVNRKNLDLAASSITEIILSADIEGLEIAGFRFFADELVIETTLDSADKSTEYIANHLVRLLSDKISPPFQIHVEDRKGVTVVFAD
ncbi:hypothetical protein MM300_19295 [Evansella sp. LMS18]|uniref:hypothetical protein n=1 Tax=Evansella sp. LMS18 TaxID=2924033 RepID=UPI0020D050D3|nr:hypothetical protein [Evansella sp. LMS18]UTR10000.1 hypothetical protein MM300_19295 [Evansella sp. LMS18]